MTRLEMLQGRLENLEDFLKEEQDKKSLYALDLKMSIKEVKAEIKQLKFARDNPVIMVD